MTPAKRTFDLSCSVPGLLALLPGFAVIAILIRLDDGGPVFYRQERIGRNGIPFRMWKFRTMKVNADKEGALITVGGDSRITRVGRLLRQMKLDELPQLINVIAGEMSLVGPRPEVARYVELYGPAQRRVLAVAPGITDPASIAFRDESEVLARSEDPERVYIDEIMPEKIRLNLAYAERSNIVTDIGTILRTLTSIAH